MVTFKSYFMHDPQIPSFYLANLKTHTFSKGPDPEGPGVRVTCPKITCEELSEHWKFCANPPNDSKVTALFRSDRHTDAQTQTKTNHLSTIREIFLHTCEGRGGKLYKPYKISTFSLREGLLEQNNCAAQQIYWNHQKGLAAPSSNYL